MTTRHFRANEGTTLNIEDLAWTTKLIRVLEEFRKVNKDTTANQILTFLLIAQKENVNQRELEKEMGLSNAAISRICAILSDRGLKKRQSEPMNLIRIGTTPGDYRFSAQSLSPNGKRVFNSLRTIMEGR